MDTETNKRINGPVTRNLLTLLWMIALFPIGSSAQTDSAAAKKYPTRFFTEYGSDRNLPLVFEDTAMRRNEIYHPYYRKNGMFQDLGNIATAGRSVFFEWNRPVDFSLGFNPWQVYFKTPQETKYYNTKKPYADFSYTQGQRDLLLFSGKYTMNFSPRLNFGVDFDRITSTGFYSRQFTSGYFSNVFGSYETKNLKYGIIGNAIWNRGLADESGGIASDSLFETLKGSNKSVPVRLQSSGSRYRCKTFYGKQYFYLGNMQQKIENEDTSYYLSRSGFISHTFRYDQENYFFDNPYGEYDSIVFPSSALADSGTVFYDSVRMNSYMNRVAYAYWTRSNEKQQSFIEFAAAHKYIEVSQQGLSHHYNNIWGEFKMERIPKTQYNVGLKLGASYCLSGYNVNDYKLNGDIKVLFPTIDLTAGLTNQLTEPDYLSAWYKSEPYTWNNRFSKISMTHWRAAIGTKRMRHNLTVSFNQYLAANWIYSSTEVAPVQTSNDLLLVNTLEASKTFQLGWFLFENKIMWQKANRDYLRIPEFGANLRYYLNANLFRKALYFQLGAEMFYNTEYYSNAYAPSARAFYMQNERQTGNYPVIDLFLTGQVMTCVIFVKYEHVNMDWNGLSKNFYQTPHYPIPVKAFRFGLRLRLYN